MMGAFQEGPREAVGIGALRPFPGLCPVSQALLQKGFCPGGHFFKEPARSHLGRAWVTTPR